MNREANLNFYKVFIEFYKFCVTGYSLMTEEQEALANCDDKVAKGEACAGSGKTYTATKYIEKNKDDNILYMCFQRAMRNEAVEKFSKFPKVQVKTFHQLAWGDYGQKFHEAGKLSSQTLTAADIRNELSLFKDSGIKVSEYALLLLNGYINSSKHKIEDTKEFLELCENESDNLLINNALLSATVIYKRMTDMTHPLPASHDVYLKQYQLDPKPRFGFKRVVIDEAQDITERDLNIFIRKVTKKNLLFIGDPHQQIFGWRGAVNALKMIKGTSYPLSATFRNGEDIAELSNYMLNKYKFANSNIEGLNKKQIIVDEIDKEIPYAIISRTNQSIIKNAINIAQSNKKIFFVGGMEKYNIGLLKDMYYFKRKGETNNNFLSKYNSFEEIKDYLEASPNPDAKLVSAINIVEDYKDELISMINKIESLTTDKADEANVFLTNVHQAKGLEFKNSIIDDDFINYRKYFSYRKMAQNNNDKASIAKLEEEINAWYVAISRAEGPTQHSSSLIALREQMYKEAEEKLRATKGFM
jgi:F-box protein, helicase, 18